MVSDSDAAVNDRHRQHEMARVTDTHVCLGVLLLQVTPGEEGGGERTRTGYSFSAVRPRAPGSSSTASAAGTRKAGPLNVAVVDTRC